MVAAQGQEEGDMGSCRSNSKKCQLCKMNEFWGFNVELGDNS